MRVTGWSVDGFGILRDYVKRDLPPGLTVFEGRNESGKSTLHDFVRGVLFGFPRAARNKGPYYPPLNGGRHGGRVFIETAGGGIIIEREVGRPPKITMDDGTVLGDTDFQLLIGGVDAQVFRTVFAFSLDELRDFDSLSDEQVRARIFAAGVGGAGPSVRGVIQQLDKRAQQALKPRALDARVNALFAEVVAHEGKLDVARRQAEDYPLLLEDEQSIRREVLAMEAEERGLRDTVAHCQRLQELWPVWHRAATARERLDDLDLVETFVADPLGRLAEVRQGLKASEDTLASLEDRLGRRQREAGDLRRTLRPELGALRPEVEKQVGLIPVLRDRGRELSLAEGRARQDQERLARQLADLGPGHDEAVVVGLDASLARAEEAREWKGKLAEATEARDREAAGLKGAALLAAKAQSEHSRLATALAQTDKPETQILEAKLEAVRALRGGLARLRAERAAIDASAALLESTERLAAGRGEVGRSARPRGLRSTLSGVSAILAAIVVVASAWAAAKGHLLIAVVAAVGAGLLALAAWLLARGVAGSRAAGSGSPALLRALDKERLVQRGRVEEVARLEAVLLGSTGILGFSRMPEQEELDRVESGLVVQRQSLVRWQDQALELVRLEERFEAARLDEQTARRTLAEAEAHLERLGAEFRAKLQGWGLPPTLSPAGAEEFVRAVRGLKDQIERRDDTEQIAARLRVEITAWEEETRRLLGSVGSGDGSSEAIPALLRLDELCRADAVVRSRLAAVEAGLEELGPEIEDARLELARRGHDRDELLGEAGAEDEAGYLLRLEAFEARKDLLRTIAEAEARLRERIGHGAAAFLEELAAGEVDVWQGQLEQAQRLLATLRGESTELVKRLGDVERRLRELEESADVVALETGLQGLRTELENALRDWRIASLASTLVRETLSRFTRERQPFVLAEASEMFEKVTGGRYERILPSAEEDGLVLVTGDGKTKLPEHLSRGAMEQLYLCLRLGLAEEFSRRTESIPLIMDDVLVNFDEERRRITAELLAGFSRRHQVLLFTCHRDVVELLREVEPDVHVVTMSEGR